jgi:type IV fimbrial biogenesis protein FimT
MNKNKNQQAFTLLELLVYLTLTSILLVATISSFSSLVEYRRITSLASTIFQDLRIAKSEAIKRNARIRMTFQSTGSNWCYGWKVNDGCDCFSENSCAIDGIALKKSQQEYPQISLTTHLTSPGNRLIFDSTRLFMANTYGHIKLKTANKEIRVIVTRTGRVRLCSPSGSTHVMGYASLC